MKTSLLDVILGSAAIMFLIGAALTTVAVIPKADGAYRPLLDVAIFVLAYAVSTSVLLAILRMFFPYPQGTYRMDSPEFTLWKLNAVLVDLAWKAFAPFMTVFTQPVILAAFGATVGRQTALGGTFRDHPLIELGDHCTIGQNSVLTAHAITGSTIYLSKIRIGPTAVVGINCVVMPGVTLGTGAVLAPGAVVTRDTQIPPYELWGGIPARFIKKLEPDTM